MTTTDDGRPTLKGSNRSRDDFAKQQRGRVLTYCYLPKIWAQSSAATRLQRQRTIHPSIRDHDRRSPAWTRASFRRGAHPSSSPIAAEGLSVFRRFLDNSIGPFLHHRRFGKWFNWNWPLPKISSIAACHIGGEGPLLRSRVPTSVCANCLLNSIGTLIEIDPHRSGFMTFLFGAFWNEFRAKWAQFGADAHNGWVLVSVLLEGIINSRYDQWFCEPFLHPSHRNYLPIKLGFEKKALYSSYGPSKHFFPKMINKSKERLSERQFCKLRQLDILNSDRIAWSFLAQILLFGFNKRSTCFHGPMHGKKSVSESMTKTS